MNLVYASLPLTGLAGSAGRDLLRGAELALERRHDADISLVALDASGEGRDEQALVNAQRAVSDPQALAYLGDFHSSQVARTAPLLSEAGMLQVAPAATFVGLGGATLVRLMPHDGVLARAIAGWLVDAGVRDLLVVHDHDEGYGVPVGRMCAEAARERGIDVRARPVWDHDEAMAGDVAGAGAVLYAGVAGSGAVAMWDALHAHDPAMWLLGTDGLAFDWFARGMSEGAAQRTRFFGAQRAPWGFYGYEAMALIADAIAAGGRDRAEIVRTARSIRDRDSMLGRYSIDADGLTTCAACGRFAVAGGEIVWDRPQRSSSGRASRSTRV